MKLRDDVGGTIDPELMPLIIELNKLGIETFASCAGHGEPHEAYIAIDMDTIRRVETCCLNDDSSAVQNSLTIRFKGLNVPRPNKEEVKK
jgi:hypothetical protein